MVVFIRLVMSSNILCMEGVSTVEVSSSCLTLVDLAGSERMTRCPAVRFRQNEGAVDIQERKVSCVGL